MVSNSTILRRFSALIVNAIYFKNTLGFPDTKISFKVQVASPEKCVTLYYICSAYTALFCILSFKISFWIL